VAAPHRPQPHEVAAYSRHRPAGATAVYSIEALYDDLEALFAAARDAFEGHTLRDYYGRLAKRQAGIGGKL
jgi:hypothetical protein